MTREWKFRLLAAGIPTLIGLIIIIVFLIKRENVVMKDGEVTFQTPPLYVQEPGHEKTGHKYLFDEQLGWRNIPNWKASTYGQALTTNSKHLRDREYPFEKPVGTKRILVLGDSFAWGYGVSDKDIFTETLENTFKRKKMPWEVINSGVSGWGNDQQYLYFTSEGVKYDPDIVVVAFYIGNDPTNNTNSIQYGLSKPVFTDLDLTLANSPVPKPPTDTSTRILSTVDKNALTVRIFEKLAERCAETGAKLVIMKFGVFQVPNNPVVRKAEALFHAHLAKIQSKLHYFDLDKAFSSKSFTAKQLTEGIEDGHWNVLGHRVVADLLRSFLTTQSLLN